MKDFCNKDGAERLRQQIACYWEERGYDVDIDLVDAGFVPAMRSARTDVRSNMVNGMPCRIGSDTSRRGRGTARPVSRNNKETQRAERPRQYA